MDWSTQRAILQIAIGVCCLFFAAGMIARCWNKHEIKHWPLKWNFLVSIWIISIGWSFLAHGARWYSHKGQAHFDDWKTIAPLYAVFGMSFWTMKRWIEDDDEMDMSLGQWIGTFILILFVVAFCLFVIFDGK